MKHYVLSNIASGIDGRIAPKRWRPQGHNPSPAYERLRDSFEAHAWLIGRVTGAGQSAYTPAINHLQTSAAQALLLGANALVR